jgi:hypothetical protein
MSAPETPMAAELATNGATPHQDAPSPSLTRAEAGRRLLEDPRVPDEPVAYYRIQQAADLCGRRPKTITHYLTKYQLPRVIGWVVHKRARRRVVLLEPRVVALLQALTIRGASRAQRKRGDAIGMVNKFRAGRRL